MKLTCKNLRPVKVSSCSLLILFYKIFLLSVTLLNLVILITCQDHDNKSKD